MNAELTTISAQDLRRFRILRRRAQECRDAQALYWQTKRRNTIVSGYLSALRNRACSVGGWPPTSCKHRVWWSIWTVSTFNPDDTTTGTVGSVTMSMQAHELTPVLAHYGFACFENDDTLVRFVDQQPRGGQTGETGSDDTDICLAMFHGDSFSGAF